MIEINITIKLWRLYMNRRWETRLIAFSNGETSENCSQFGWDRISVPKLRNPIFWSKVVFISSFIVSNRAIISQIVSLGAVAADASVTAVQNRAAKSQNRAPKWSWWCVTLVLAENRGTMQRGWGREKNRTQAWEKAQYLQ
jgi:hypothetical protein